MDPLKETRGMIPCIVLWQWKRGNGAVCGMHAAPVSSCDVEDKREGAKAPPPASHPSSASVSALSPLACLFALLPARVLGWSTCVVEVVDARGVDVTALHLYMLLLYMKYGKLPNRLIYVHGVTAHHPKFGHMLVWLLG